jgi:excisionase family DNA binding protein
MVMDAELNSMTKKRVALIPVCPENCQGWHSVNQVAAILAISRVQVYRLMKEGALRYEQRAIGRRVRHDWIDEYMRSEFASTD